MPADQPGPIVRSQQAIENNLHGVLAMVFRDDECRVRTDNAPANFATIKHIAANLLRLPHDKHSLRSRSKIAAWDDSLAWLMQWYLAECNSDWEHSYGVKIDTLDNPGWTLKIDLRETELHGRRFVKATHGEPADDLEEWQRLGSWWVADVKGDVFETSCGPLDLPVVPTVSRLG